MKRSKKDELRAKKISELHTSLREAEEQLVKLTMEVASGRVKNRASLRGKKQEIAVIKTLIREKQLNEEAAR